MCGAYPLVNKQTRLNKYAMPLLEEIFKMLLIKPRLLVLWTWGLTTISYYWGRVIRSRYHFGELIPMGRIVYTNGSFCHLVWKMPLQNFKGSWIQCWWVSVLPNATLMTSLILTWTRKSYASFAGGAWKT